VFRLFHAIIRTALIERFKSPFQISKSNLVFEKDVASKYSLRHRNWNTLAFRGRLMSLLELRSVGSHRGLSSRWSLAYSSCLAGLSFSTGCFTIPIHPIIIYMILLFVNSKRYPVDWNGRRRLLGLGLRTARPIENHCDYSTHRRHLRE